MSLKLQCVYSLQEKNAKMMHCVFKRFSNFPHLHCPTRCFDQLVMCCLRWSSHGQLLVSWSYSWFKVVQNQLRTILNQHVPSLNQLKPNQHMLVLQGIPTPSLHYSLV